MTPGAEQLPLGRPFCMFREDGVLISHFLVMVGSNGVRISRFNAAYGTNIELAVLCRGGGVATQSSTTRRPHRSQHPRTRSLRRPHRSAPVTDHELKNLSFRAFTTKERLLGLEDAGRSAEPALSSRDFLTIRRRSSRRPTASVGGVQTCPPASRPGWIHKDDDSGREVPDALRWDRGTG